GRLAGGGRRRAIRRGRDLPLHEAEIMAEAFRERVVRTDDAKEGPQAFLEKRDPVWRCRGGATRPSSTRRATTTAPRSRSTRPTGSTPSTARCARRARTRGGRARETPRGHARGGGPLA